MHALDQLAEALRERLVERAREGADARPVVEQVQALVESEAQPLPETERRKLADRVLRLATGLGPLDELLSDPGIDEVMVNGGGQVYVERAGRVEAAATSFADQGEL